MKKITALLLVVITILSITACNNNGSKLVKAREYKTDYAITFAYNRFNGQRTETLNLDEGKEVLFNIESESGTLDMVIEDSNGNTVFEKYWIQNEEFAVQLDAGEYKIVIDGWDHVGSYNIMWAMPKASSTEYVNPYSDLPKGGQWLKSSFHAHSGEGFKPLDLVLDAHVQTQFDVIAISNNNVYTDTSLRTTPKLLMVPGVEYAPEKSGHMLHIGVDESFHKMGWQDAINKVNEKGGFTIMAHPNANGQGRWYANELLMLDGYSGIEVINQTVYRLGGSGLATDVWDFLLKRGKMVFGFGNDGLHVIGDIGRSYNLIYSIDKSYESIKEAIDKGQFVATTGLYPDYLRLEGDTIKVKVKYPINTYANTFTYRFIADGKVVSVQTGTDAQYKLNGEKYVRVEAIGENGFMIFFQPVYLKDAFSK